MGAADTLKSVIKFQKAGRKKIGAAVNLASDAIETILNPNILDIAFITVFLAIPACTAVGFAILGLTIANGSTFNPGPQCYMSTNSYSVETVTLDGKGYKVKGSTPKNQQDIGQMTTWVDTGLITTGEPMEVSVSGKWYPWGISETKTTYKTVEHKKPSIRVNEGDYMSQPSYTQEYVETPCKLSTDLKPRSEDVTLEDPMEQEIRKNQLLRYASQKNKSVAVDEQIEQFYNNSCYLENGHGVYMKIGEASQFAYHLANYEVLAEETVYSDQHGNKSRRPIISTPGKPGIFVVPFSLPSKIYDPNFDSTKPKNETNLDNHLIEANANNSPYIHLAQESSCTGDIADRLRYPNETCPPPKNQKIFLAINDIEYNGNDGTVEVRFANGAKKESVEYLGGAKQQGTSFLQTIATFMMEPIFGPQDTSKYQPGSLFELNNQTPGMIVELRNRILSSFYFQALRVLLLVIHLTMIGYEIVLGGLELKMTDILKRTLTVGIAMWGTEPTNYQLIDDIIVPLYFRGIITLFSALFNAAASISGLNLNVTNPFFMFDIIARTVVSELTMYHVLASFVSNPLFFILLVPILILCLSLVVSAFRAFFIALMGIMQLGFLLAILPFALLLMINQSTSEYMKKTMNRIETQLVTTMFFLFVMSIVFFIALMYYKKILGFSICWKEIFSFSLFGLIKISFYGWDNVDTFNIAQYTGDVAVFAIAVYMSSRADYIMQDVGKIFGGPGLYSEGASFVRNFLGAAESTLRFIPMPWGIKQITFATLANLASGEKVYGRKIATRSAARSATIKRGVIGTLAKGVGTIKRKLTPKKDDQKDKKLTDAGLKEGARSTGAPSSRSTVGTNASAAKGSPLATGSSGGGTGSGAGAPSSRSTVGTNVSAAKGSPLAAGSEISGSGSSSGGTGSEAGAPSSGSAMGTNVSAAKGSPLAAGSEISGSGIERTIGSNLGRSEIGSGISDASIGTGITEYNKFIDPEYINDMFKIRNAKPLLDNDAFKEFNKEHLQELRNKVAEGTREQDTQRAGPPKSAISIGDISGVQTSVGAETVSTESKITSSKSGLQDNLVTPLNAIGGGQTATTEGEKNAFEKMQADSRETKDRKNRAVLKDQSKEIVSEIDKLLAAEPNSKDYQEKLKKVVASSAALGDFASKNKLNIGLTDLAKTASSGENISEAAQELGKQTNLLSMLYNAKSRKKK